MRSSLVGAYAMNKVKSMGLVILLARIGSSGCRLQSGSPLARTLSKTIPTDDFPHCITGEHPLTCFNLIVATWDMEKSSQNARYIDK
jgi:hypothetical protein